MKKCNTLPARIANRGWSHNWRKNISSNANLKLMSSTCKPALSLWMGPLSKVSGRHNLNWMIGSEKHGYRNHVTTYFNENDKFNDNLNDAYCRWPELPSEASLVRTPAGTHARARILGNQLVIGIPKKSFNCAVFSLCIRALAYMSHVVTTTLDKHRRVKHIGAWSPGLAQHPGEASPGGRMDQSMKVLGRRWSFITCKDTLQYIYIYIIYIYVYNYLWTLRCVCM